MFVGVFQADVENRGLFAAIQTFFELFFGDAFDGHGAILAVPRRRQDSVAGSRYADRCCGATVAARTARARGPRGSLLAHAGAVR